MEVEKEVKDLFRILEDGHVKIEKIENDMERVYERNYAGVQKLARIGEHKVIGAFIAGTEVIFGNAVKRTKREMFNEFLKRGKEFARKHNAAIVYHSRGLGKDFEITSVRVIIPLVERPTLFSDEKQFIEFIWTPEKTWIEEAIWTTMWEKAKGDVKNFYTL